ncbi:MAG: hypothetical protein NTV02_00610 [Candidatus Zambryskibacteria bacterium]|nr:hypothetical protein [Candidatus Zambryskibacteria bacterium]
MLFRSSDKKGDVCLVLDIGNASLAASLVHFKVGESPEFLYTVRLPLRISEHAHSEKLQATLFTQLTSILEQVGKRGFAHEYFKKNDKKIAKVLCVFASPWYVSKTKKVPISNTKPFVITKAFLDDVILKETELFQKELQAGAHGEEFKKGVVVVEKTIVDARINGYFLNNPVGQKTNECVVTLYLGLSSEEIVSRIQEELFTFFHTKHLDCIFHSFPLVAHKTLSLLFPGEKDYLICDISGEVTDITKVSAGVVGDTKSFPSGKFFLIRKLAAVLDVPLDVALSFLHLWKSRGVTADMDEKINQVISDVEHEWSIYLEDALSSLGEISTLPKKIFITIDTDVADVFLEFLKIQKTDATGVWRKNIVPLHLSEEVLKHFYVSKDHLTFDECIAIDSIFLGSFQ